jgi:outer membrane receptor protein involved in Fe transport
MKSFGGFLALTAGLMGSTALAQPVAIPADPAAASPAPAGAVQQGGIEDIIVTARKREESSQNIPVAVTAISGKQIDQQNLTSFEKLGAYTPQLTIARSANGSGGQITLRGIGSNPGSIGIEQSVAVIVDNVYYGQGRIINEGFFDLAGLEILKGPQSLFFGKNATAGVISLTTANPTDHFAARVRAGYELNAQQVYTEGFASGPIGEDLGIRVAMRASKMFGGLIRNDSNTTNFNLRDVATNALIPTTAPPGIRDVPGERELLGRITLQWRPTDQITATIKASANSNNTNNPAWNGVVSRCANGFSFLDKVTPCKRKFVIHQNRFPVGVGDSFPIVGANGDTFNRYQSYNGTGTLEYAGEMLNVTGIVNYNKNINKLAVDADNQSFGAVNVYATERVAYDAFSTEIRALTKSDGAVNLLVGGYYQSTKRDFDQFAFNANLMNSAAPDPKYTYVAFSKDSETKGETISAYGQLIWQVVPRVELTGGVRYIHETKDSYFFQPYVNPALRAPAGRFVEGTRTTNVIEADQTFNNWSPEATATWRPTDDLTLYVNYKTAYKSGGFSNSALNTVLGSPSDLVFEPEKVKGFEGGLKSTLADRQLRANLALYSYRYDGFQIDFQNSQTFAFVTTNAGSVKAKGAELELQFQPRALPELALRGSLNYNRARYGNFLAPCYSGQSIVMGCTPGSYRGGNGQQLRGKPTTNSPEWTAAVGGSYETDVGGGNMLQLTVDSRYSDSYFASAFNSPLSRQPSYVNIDASLRLRTGSDRWEIALIGKNLTNNFVVTGSADAPSTGSGTGTNVAVLADQRSYISLPRTVQAQVTFNF